MPLYAWVWGTVGNHFFGTCMFFCDSVSFVCVITNNSFICSKLTLKNFFALDASPSPFGNSLYGGVSPMYGRNPSLSPHYPVIDTLGKNPSPSTIQFNLAYNEFQQPQQTLPPISNVMHQNWNIATTSTVAIAAAAAAANMHPNISEMNIDSASGLSSLLDLDSQQLRQINLNSDDLHMFDTNNLSENLSNNLLLTDEPRNIDQNMSDSLTRLANNAFENMLPQ